ncbi:MAG: ABC transporter permease subunit [Pseudomonadota bacterium]
MVRAVLSRITIWLPYIWLGIFFLAPFFLVAKLSLSEYAIAQPPYVPVFTWAEGLSGWWEDLKKLSFENYVFITEDSLYWRSYLSSVQIALVATSLTLLIGYPIAYGIARAPARLRPILVMLVILPFWTSFLIRVYAWIGILKKEGLLNQFLLWLGIIGEPLTILNTNWAVYIGIVYSYLPFMVLPLYANLEKQDGGLLEAAQDLGSTRFGAFWQVTFPLSLPGVLAGCFLVFIPTVGEFVIPALLGGSETLMIGQTLYDEFFKNRDWPVSSTVAILLLLVLIIPIMLFQRSQARAREAAR